MHLFSSKAKIRHKQEGPEGVKWELGLAGFCPGKMGFKPPGLGFGHWEWGQNVKNGNGINSLEP